MGAFSRLKSLVFGNETSGIKSETKHEQSKGLRHYPIAPVIGMNVGETPEAIVRKTVAQFRQIPEEQITDDMTIGEEGSGIIMSLVFVTGVTLFGSETTTVRDLIQQIETAP